MSSDEDRMEMPGENLDGPPPVAGDPAMPSGDERTMGMLCHLLAFVGLLGIPFGNILGPLVIWLVKKGESAFVDDQGKESLNFNISVVIYGIISGVLTLVLIGIFLLIALGIFWLVVTIMAALAANKGQYYRYPLCIRILK